MHISATAAERRLPVIRQSISISRYSYGGHGMSEFWIGFGCGLAMAVILELVGLGVLFLLVRGWANEDTGDNWYWRN